MLTRWIMQDGETALIERLVLTYGNPVDFKTSLPYEVDISGITNERELDSWLYHQDSLAYKFFVSSYCPIKQRQLAQTVVRFVDAKKAIEYKLQITY